jgi:hypothetical protein
MISTHLKTNVRKPSYKRSTGGNPFFYACFLFLVFVAVMKYFISLVSEVLINYQVLPILDA